MNVNDLTKEERDGIENVSDDQLQGQMVDPKAVANPSEESVYHRDERQNGKNIGP